MSCEECRDLSTHAFRSPDDLIHAVRLATEEMERGVLCQVKPLELESMAQEALDSFLAVGALPNSVRYRFSCKLCGDNFSLNADTATGEGGWTREGDHDAP